nr:MAG: hypothetical protein [Bacteriophage sp.]
MKDVKFVVQTEASEEIINEFHKIIAQALINKYGIETMKDVLKELRRVKDKK